MFCSFSDGLGGWSTVGDWWFSLEALGKALLWTVLIEVVGFGGASGPLTARYMPPLGGITYWLLPGTVKMPLFRGLGDRRSWLEVLLYVALLGFLVAGCVAPAVTPSVVAPVLILLVVLGVLDRTIFLAARADVWFPSLFMFLFPLETAPALKVVWFSIWFWAAFSKLTPTFTSVVAVMICNSPFLKFPWLKKMMFRSYPSDLRLSRSANYIAHFGTLVEFALPVLLMTGTLLGWPVSMMTLFLIGMTAFHFFIFINYPMGVPMEWNVIVVYGGWLLFGHDLSTPLAITSWPILALFAICFLALPLLGNFHPRHVSFLLSMRYYTGTWPFSVWLFRKGSKLSRMEPAIRKTSADLRIQLQHFYDEETNNAILSKVVAFRLMHLPARCLHDVLPLAVSDIDSYYWQDGEFVAGEVLGWNFGDGHLHSERLLESVQKRACFEPGELRVIMVESPQLHNGRLHWRVHDAADGLLHEGHAYIRDLQARMPWPDCATPTMPEDVTST